MRKLSLAVAALCCAVLCHAQTNIAFTSIKVKPSVTKTNFNEITLNITNLHENWTYSLPIAPYVPTEPGESFTPYIRFSSPSNSIVIVRSTTNSIHIRFYEVAPYGFAGFAGDTNAPVGADEGSYWDTHDPACEQCDQQQFLSDMRATLTRFGLIDEPPPVPQEVLDIINPPPLRNK